MARKRCAPATSLQLFGFPISSCSRVEEDGAWSLFCPNEAPGLADCWGEAFDELYLRYEEEGRARQVKSKLRNSGLKYWNRKLRRATPTCSTKMPATLNPISKTWEPSNPAISALRSSSIQLPDEIAVCNLASLALPRFVIHGAFDHRKLYEVTQAVTRNLNRIIDGNYLSRHAGAPFKFAPSTHRHWRTGPCRPLFAAAPSL